MEAAELGTLIIKTLQEYLYIRSIQALAKQPETFFWRLLFDSHVLSHQLLALLFCPGSNPIIKDAKANSAIDCLKMNNTQIEEEQIWQHPQVPVKVTLPENVNSPDDWGK